MAAEQAPNTPLDDTQDNAIVQIINGKPITESMKLTRYLVGQMQVQPTVMEWEGSRCLMFVFNVGSVTFVSPCI